MSAAMIQTMEGEIVKEDTAATTDPSARIRLENIYNNLVSAMSLPHILQKACNDNYGFDATEAICLADVLQLFIKEMDANINALDALLMEMK